MVSVRVERLTTRVGCAVETVRDVWAVMVLPTLMPWTDAMASAKAVLLMICAINVAGTIVPARTAKVL
jgi:hypothetical protein